MRTVRFGLAMLSILLLIAAPVFAQYGPPEDNPPPGGNSPEKGDVHGAPGGIGMSGVINVTGGGDDDPGCRRTSCPRPGGPGSPPCRWYR